MPTPFSEGCVLACPHCGVTVRVTGLGVRVEAPDVARFLQAAGSVTARVLQSGRLAGTVRNVQTGDPVERRLVEVAFGECPSCRRPVIALNDYEGDKVPAGALGSTRFVWPRVASRRPVHTAVPKHIREDYEEAALVLADSEKASAALSRRCMQTLLREKAGTTARDLADQIEEVLPNLPAHIAGQVDAVRNIGNFAAHVQKSKATGEILDVEPGEAEWNLEVLDLLFDFYCVQPALIQERRDALNKKLAAAGKPPMK